MGALPGRRHDAWRAVWTTLVEPYAATAEQLAQVLMDGGHLRLGVVSTVGELASRRQMPEVVVLGPGVDFGHAADLALRRRALEPGFGTVLVRRTTDALLLTEADRAGFTAVTADGDVPGLIAAVVRAITHARIVAPSPVGTPPALQLAVLSAKGGVGKSLVAVNLAASLAGRGSRTCLVDLDFHAGDVAPMLGLAPRSTLADAGPLTGIDAGAVSALVVPHAENLDVLPAPLRGGSPIPPHQAVGAVLEVLAEEYDAVILDTSCRFDEPAVQAIDACELAVLVGTIDVLSLTSLKRAAGTLDLLGLPRDRWRLVLNRADRGPGLSAEDFQRELGLPATAIIPESVGVRAALHRGEPVVRSAPRDKAAQALDGLATTLLQGNAVRTGPVAHSRERRDRRRPWKVGSR